MTGRICKILMHTALVLCVSVSFANADIIIEEPIQTSASDQCLDVLEEYRDKKKFEWGATGKDGKIFYYETTGVEADHNSRGWGKARALAFEQSLLDAQAKFIKDQFGRNFTSTAKKLFQDNSDDVDQFERIVGASGTKGKLIAIGEKVLALGDAHLNQQLEEMGVDASELDSAPVTKKRVLYMKELTKKSMVRAMGSISGLVPIQTFECNDADGNHKISVVMMFSPKLKQLASDIANGRKPRLEKQKGVGQPVREFIPQEAKVLVNQFGIRIGFDENNVPYLVSYGQWSYLDKNLTERKRERRKKVALEQAASLADQQITMFLAGRLQYEDEKEQGEKIEEVIKGIFNTDGSINNTEEIEFSKIIDRVNQEIKVTANAQMAGRSTVHTGWRFKHEYGHEIVGVVRAWTLEGAVGAEKIKNWEAELENEEKKKQTDALDIDAGVTAGEDQMDMDDF